MINKTSEQVRNAPNPSGKGGFGEHPENINAGGRPKNIERYDYWFQYFKDMKYKDFLALADEDKSEWPTAKVDAYNRYRKISHLKEFQEVANRTEGMPRQTVKQEFDDDVTEVKIEIRKNESKPPGN